jgi:hydrogenase maturation protein HypF
VGSYFKNTVAIYQKNQVFISQHIGDLDTVNAVNHFENILDSLKKLYEFAPEVIACDAHPEYLATKYAYSLNLPVIPIQHHYAHVLSCMAEHQLQPPVLGVAWDGTGYGLDGTIWGENLSILLPILGSESPILNPGHYSEEKKRLKNPDE